MTGQPYSVKPAVASGHLVMDGSNFQLRVLYPKKKKPHNRKLLRMPPVAKALPEFKLGISQLLRRDETSAVDPVVNQLKLADATTLLWAISVGAERHLLQELWLRYEAAQAHVTSQAADAEKRSKLTRYSLCAILMSSCHHASAVVSTQSLNLDCKVSQTHRLCLAEF